MFSCSFKLMQSALKERIKQWLRAQLRSRSWLAEQCGVKKRTVDNWLSSPQAIPAKALRIIERLMSSDADKPDASGVPDNLLILSVNQERFTAYNRASLAEGMTIADWALHALDEAAAEDAE